MKYFLLLIKWLGDNMKSLLIIEDDPMFPTLIERVLGKEFVCTVAPTYADAARELKKQSFDLVWCDLRLPDSHQDLTLGLVKGLAGTAAIVVCTGVVQDISSIHADAVSRKPITPESIASLASEAMANARKKIPLERTVDSITALTSASFLPIP